MVKDQSWPQFGASTMSVCPNATARIRPIAFLVPTVHGGTPEAPLPCGSLPMFRMTYFSCPLTSDP
jgi:hypothetical protein